LKKIIAESERYERIFALLYIDLDGFKAVNDSQGHKAGDSLLKEAAARIKNNIRASDTSARLGGDEFAVILNSLNTPVTAEIVAKKILETLAEPIDINGRKNYIGASIGISLYPDNGRSSDELIQRADEAMYYVKKTGKHNYRFYI
jgi:diguanylate cyclase (GGDEF)-like protein